MTVQYERTHGSRVPDLMPDDVTDEQRIAALKYVATHALNADDLRELIDELGLNGRPMRSSAKLRAQQGARNT